MKKLIQYSLVLMAMSLSFVMHAQTELVDQGTADACYVNVPGNYASYGKGNIFTFRVALDNTGPATLKIDLLTPISIKKNFNLDLAAGDLIQNMFATVVYDGTNFQLLTVTANPAAAAGWYLNGNNADSLSNFLGTNNPQPLIIKTSGVERMRIRTNGYVGIGTASPKSALQLGSHYNIFPVNVTASENYNVQGYNTIWDGSTIRTSFNGPVALSYIGDDNNKPLWSVSLYNSLLANTDVLSASPVTRLNLKGKGLAINKDQASSALDVSSSDSVTAIFYRSDNGKAPIIELEDGSAIGRIGIRAPSTVSIPYLLTLPNNNGNSGDVLKTDGSGNLSWAATAGDNLGDHIATTNIQLKNFWLTNDDSNFGLSVATDGSVLIDQNAANGAKLYLDNANMAIFANTANQGEMTFLTSSAERIRIASNGLVGVGVTNPQKRFHVGVGGVRFDTLNLGGTSGLVRTNALGDISKIAFTGSSTDVLKGDGTFGVGAGDNLGSHTATSNIQLGTFYLSGDGGNEGVFVSNAGNVGIGTNVPASKLEVEGDISGGGMLLASQSLYNLVNTNSTSYVTLVSVPVYVPAGSSSIRASVLVNVSNSSGTGSYRYKIGGKTSAIATSTSTTANTLLSEILLDNSTSPVSGWQILTIEVQISNSSYSASLSGYSVSIKQ